MIIPCPFCGPRDLAEFTYHGDAARAAARPAHGSTDQEAWDRHVYDRRNPAGSHAEIWQHAGGCRSHLRVVRDTRTHEITETTLYAPEVSQ
ncbi:MULTISPECIES: sarcosine oxidase subunit delta [unclassified Roseitalea]|uniref:sarcosine oxidase subunit delta n=1 Tax=unclassified Roseitalea TaxID=2639107 RepID=UPI00273DD2CA|nr:MULTISPECIES: sarcosine oxidase subunit delta [unclassified Roseitalea]